MPKRPREHRVENRVGMRRVAYFADRTCAIAQMLLLSLGKRDLSWVFRIQSTSPLCSCALQIASHSLDGFPAVQVRSVYGIRCIRVAFRGASVASDEISFEDRLAKPSFELPSRET